MIFRHVAVQPASRCARHTPQAKHWDACAPILEQRGKLISGEDDGGDGALGIIAAAASVF
jgi:hypothetical protein